jgi:hypothetical protein
MNFLRLSLPLILATSLTASAGVSVDATSFGERLGGWNKRGKSAAEYALSGATYRTYRPEVTPTPDGGLFVSLRIDHVRGWLSSNDHAVLEVTISKDGSIATAQSSIAIQGRSITSDLIRGGTDAGQKLAGVDRAVQIGTDLVADLSAKMLREKIVEAGRVSFPAVLRHNYNILYQSIRVAEAPAPAQDPADGGAAPQPPANPPSAGLEIQQFGGVPKATLPTGN